MNPHNPRVLASLLDCIYCRQEEEEQQQQYHQREEEFSFSNWRKNFIRVTHQSLNIRSRREIMLMVIQKCLNEVVRLFLPSPHYRCWFRCLQMKMRLIFRTQLPRLRIKSTSVAYSSSSASGGTSFYYHSTQRKTDRVVSVECNCYAAAVSWG